MKKNIWIPLGILAGAMLLFGLIMATAPYWGKAAQQEESAVADQLVEKEETPAPDLPEQAEKEENPAPEQPEEPAQEKEPIKEEDDSGNNPPDNSLPLENKTPVTKEQAIEIAREHGVTRYGKEFELYRFEKCSLSRQEPNEYEVLFHHYIGEEEYILASSIRFQVEKYGAVSGIRFGWIEYSEFDQELLKSFSKKDVEAFAEQTVQEKYGDELSRAPYEMHYNSISLERDYDENVYYLDIYLSFILEYATDANRPFSCRLRYDFPQ